MGWDGRLGRFPGRDEIATDTGGPPGGERGGDDEIVVLVLAAAGADGGDFPLKGSAMAKVRTYSK